MIRRVGEVLGLQAEPASQAVDLASLADDRAVEGVPRVELEAGLCRQHLEDPSGYRSDERRRGDQAGALAIEDPVVIVAAREGELLVACADARADRRRLPEVHRRPRDSAQLAGRDETGADGREAARAQGKAVAENVVSAVEIEVAVVGEVADGGPVRRCLVIDLERVTVRQPVDDDGFEGTRVAFFTVPARIAELQRGAGEGTSGPHRLVEAARPAVQMVFSVVPRQRAGPSLEREATAGDPIRVSPDDGLRRDDAGAGVRAQPGKPVFLGQHALHDRQEALQVELLVEHDADVALLQTLDGGRREIDAAGGDRARLLSRLLQRLPDEGRYVAMLRADGLHVRVLLEVSGEDGHRLRAVVVHLGADLDVVHLQPGSLERVVESLIAPAAFGLRAQAVLERLVSALQPAVLHHLLRGELAALVEIDARVSEAVRAVHALQLRQRRVARGHHDAALDRVRHERSEGFVAGVAHDLDARGRGGERLAEMLQHDFRLPPRVLLDELDAECRRGGAGAVGARQGRAVARIASHLEIHVDALAQRFLGAGGGGWAERGQADHCEHRCRVSHRAPRLSVEPPPGELFRTKSYLSRSARTNTLRRSGSSIRMWPITAARKTTPTTARTQNPCRPVATSPASTIPMMNEPATVPTRDALPPNTDVPPMNTAAITSRRYPPPWVLKKLRFSKVRSTEANAAITPMSTKARVLSRCTFTPTTSATRALSPMKRRCSPKRWRLSTR